MNQTASKWPTIQTAAATAPLYVSGASKVTYAPKTEGYAAQSCRKHGQLGYDSVLPRHRALNTHKNTCSRCHRCSECRCPAASPGGQRDRSVRAATSLYTP